MKPIVLVGGGGHCKSVIDAIESIGRKVYGILEKNFIEGETLLGYPIIGNDDDIPKFVDNCQFLVTVGSIEDSKLRIHLHELINKAGGELTSVTASTAYVSPHAHIGPGTVVLQHASINADVKIGKGCIINTCANIEHDAEIGDYVHVSTGAMVNGGCKIGAKSFIGSGAVVVNGKKLGEEVIIGAGAVVCSDILQPGIYKGIPVK